MFPSFNLSPTQTKKMQIVLLLFTQIFGAFFHSVQDAVYLRTYYHHAL